MLKASGKKVALLDNIAVLGAHSLSHFLIYDILAGWQGTQEKELIYCFDKQKEKRARYLLEISIKKNSEKFEG